jgi:nuclear pore complex protein Nup121
VSLPQKPVSLKRSLVSETSDDILKKKARMYSRRSPPSKLTCGSPVPEHNSIRSSYRTTPGISQLGKKRGPTSSLFAGPASSGSQQPERPAENPREEELGHGLSTPAPAPQVIDKESPGSQQPEKTAENTSEEELDHGSSTPAPAPQVIDKESHEERAEEDSTRKEPKSSTALPTSGSSGFRITETTGGPTDRAFTSPACLCQPS